MNVLFLTSTLPRFEGDHQAPFVLEQATAWKQARPDDNLYILAPHDAQAATAEQNNGNSVQRFRYMWPVQWQRLAYPAIMPNLRRNPLLALQIPFYLWAQYRAAKRLIKDHNIDLIYAHWVMPQGVVAQRLNRSTGVPYILQNHSSDLAVFQKLGRFGTLLARRILTNAQAFFCVNINQRHTAQEIVPGLLCNVLPMGVAMQVSDAPDLTESDNYKYALGTISRLSRKKGINHLIAAAEMMAKAGHRPKIAIAGDGEDADSIKAMPEESDVTFTGFITGDEKQQFFDDCFSMIFSSVSTNGDVEGLPVSVLEAMAAGKPIIASRDTNITLLEEWPEMADCIELLDDPADATAFADAIKRLLSRGSKTVANHAKVLSRIANRYRWDQLIGEYLMVIERGDVDLGAAPSRSNALADR